MKVFISSDIEGTNGITNWNETDKKGGAEYNYFAAKMTAEVNAVCLGINDFDASAGILVKDAHDSARNIDHKSLPPNVRLSRGWSGDPASMVSCLDASFDASIFTGYHSPAFTAGNPLAHTMNSKLIACVKINGNIAGEFHVNYYAALTLGVPVVMVSGDKHLCDMVKETDADIIAVPAFEGCGNSTINEHPDIILSRLREASREAVSKAASLKAGIPGKLPESFEIFITYKQHQTAFRASYFPGVFKVDDMTVGYKCDNFFDFLKAWIFI